MYVTKPYEFIRFGAMYVTKTYEFMGFGAMYVTKPYEFIGFGAMYGILPQKRSRKLRGCMHERARKLPEDMLDALTWLHFGWL